MAEFDTGRTAATFGIWTPRFLSARDKRAYELAATLAWAAANELPFTDALHSLLPRDGAQLLTGCLGCVFLSGPLVAPFFVGQARFHGALRRTIGALESGESLSVALDRYLRHILPAAYVRGVGEAEAQGRLKELLPVLARALSQAGQGRPAWILGFWTYYLFIALGALTLAAGVSWRIMPRYCQMIREISPDTFMGQGGRLLLKLSSGWFIPPLWFGLALLPPVLLVGLFFWYFVLGPDTRLYNSAHAFVDGLGDLAARLFGCLPLVGHLVRLRRRLELAQSMAIALHCGQDVIRAASWTAAGTGSWRLRQRLRRFVDGASAGQPWFAAWRAARLFDPTGLWLLQNAAPREDLAGGFALVAELTATDLESHTRRVRRAITLALTVVGGLAVGLLVIAIFQGLVTLITQACLIEG